MGYQLTERLGGRSGVVERDDRRAALVCAAGRARAVAGRASRVPAGLPRLVGIAPRHGHSWQGDWASNFNWIRQDRIFRRIPTGGTVDFAFADLIPETVIVGLTPRDFAGNVHAGLFVGWLHHTVALVAERQIAGGRLMICTYSLRDHLGTHPVATIMMQDMIARTAAQAPPTSAPGW